MRVITGTIDEREPTSSGTYDAVRPATKSTWLGTLDANGPLLLAAARSITQDEAEAEDLVQWTFERALRAAPSIRDPAAIRAWLLTVETREALRVVRRLRRTLRLDPVVHEIAVGGPETTEALELDEALRHLSRPIRAAVVLHHMIGLSIRETAAVLGIRENTAKARVKTGLVRLREWFDEE